MKAKIILITAGGLIFACVIICLIFLFTNFRANGQDAKADHILQPKNCRTIFPIVIAHHWGPPRFREKDADGNTVDYFYRPVVEILRKNGADIRVARYSHDYDTTPARARELKDFILTYFINNGKYRKQWSRANPGKSIKVNIIAHSQGCQDSRYMISNLDMARYTASWTGLAGESRGTPMADIGILFYDNFIIHPIADWYLAKSFPESGSLKRFIESVRCLTEDYMQNTGQYRPGGSREGHGFFAPYASSVYYQNWAAKVTWIPNEWKDLYLLWKYVYIKRGDNDIYTPVASQIHDEKYVINRGILEGEACCAGVHHMAFTGSMNQENPGFNQDQFWIDVVSGLREKGF